MAAKKKMKAPKMTAGAMGAGEGGGTAVLALPEGYTTGKNKFYAEGVARRFAMLPATGGPRGATVRLLLVVNPGTTDEQVTGLLGNPRYRLENKAPGIWAASLEDRDMDGTVNPNTGADKMFRWVDLAHRFYGIRAAKGTTATVALDVEGEAADAKRKLKQLGFTMAAQPEANPEEDGEWVNPDAGLMLGTIAAEKLYDLALWTRATSIEVRPGPGQGGGNG